MLANDNIIFVILGFFRISVFLTVLLEILFRYVSARRNLFCAGQLLKSRYVLDTSFHGF